MRGWSKQHINLSSASLDMDILIYLGFFLGSFKSFTRTASELVVFHTSGARLRILLSDDWPTLSI